MLLARFLYDGTEAYGAVAGERISLIDGNIFGNFQVGEQSIPLVDVKILPPVQPSKILAVAANYHSHYGQLQRIIGEKLPSQPELFLKPPSAVIASEEEIVLPTKAGRVDCEGELVAVVGNRCYNVAEEDALAQLLGYTCGNDVSGRGWQRDDLQWWRAKGCDSFAPIGPWIATELDPGTLELQTRLNGKICQRTNTSLLIHNIAKLISAASQVMTLEPGDIMFSGTPGNPAALSHGDIVEVEIDGIGVLRNPVRAS